MLLKEDIFKMGVAYNTSIVTDGLVFGIDAANPRCYSGSGITVIGFTGIGSTLVNGVGYSTSNFGYFTFDGTNDYILSSPTTIQTYNNNFTVEFVARPTNYITLSSESTSGTAGIFGKRHIIDPEYDDTGGGFGVALGNNGVEVLEHSAGYLPVLMSYSADLSNIKHYTIQVVNKQSSLYINGVFVRQGLQSTKSVTTLKNNRSLGYGAYGYYLGQLHSIKFYNRALTAQEIQQNYAAIRGRYGI